MSHQYEQLSNDKRLWMQKSEGVTNKDYASFYKSPSNGDNKLAVKHFNVEGELVFCALIFVPRRASLDLSRRISRGETTSSSMFAVCSSWAVAMS